MNETATYYIQLRVPQFIVGEVEKPSGMTDEELFKSLTVDDVLNLEDDIIQAKYYFDYNEDVFCLTYCEEECDD